MDFKKYVQNFIKEEEGIGVVEIILILVVLVGLVIIFKDNISQIVTNAFEAITRDTDGLFEE